MGAGSYLPTQRGTSSASLRTAAPDRRPHTAPDLLPVAYPRSREHDEEPLQRWRIPTRARSNSANFLTHDILDQEPATAWRVTAGSAGDSAGARSSGRAQAGSHQFHFPNTATRAGTSSPRTMVASSRIPAPNAVAATLRSVSGPVDSAPKAKNMMSAAPVTSRPVRPMPSMTPASVDPVRSRSSRIRVRMNTSYSMDSPKRNANEINGT